MFLILSTVAILLKEGNSSFKQFLFLRWVYHLFLKNCACSRFHGLPCVVFCKKAAIRALCTPTHAPHVCESTHEFPKQASTPEAPGGPVWQTGAPSPCTLGLRWLYRVGRACGPKSSGAQTCTFSRRLRCGSVHAKLVTS